MGRKGKEPAGLRRWRLAHKKRKTRSRPRKVKTVGRRGRRYGRKRKGGKSKSFAVLPIVPIAFVAKDSYDKAGGLNTNMLNRLVESTTGYNMIGKTYSARAAMPFWMGEVAAIVVHKVANKTGVNKHVRKLSMGYLSI